MGNGFKVFGILGAKPRVSTILYEKKLGLDRTFEVRGLNYPTRFTVVQWAMFVGLGLVSKPVSRLRVSTPAEERGLLSVPYS